MSSSRVLVMDFVSPLSSLSGLVPPDGGTAWMHDGRNFSRNDYFPADEVLGGVDVVMIPKPPAARSTTELMEEIYGGYLDQHFRQVRETDLRHVDQTRRASVDQGASGLPAFEYT
jgi:hypothetical protein